MRNNELAYDGDQRRVGVGEFERRRVDRIPLIFSIEEFREGDLGQVYVSLIHVTGKHYGWRKINAYAELYEHHDITSYGK